MRLQSDRLRIIVHDLVCAVLAGLPFEKVTKLDLARTPLRLFRLPLKPLVGLLDGFRGDLDPRRL